MKMPKLFAAIALSAVALAPSLADARSHHHHRYGITAHEAYENAYRLPYPISYLHNYGPGQLPGSFDYYDGPSTNFCYQGSAGYIGQDGRRHPCF
jgi:hypothetical protein